jgi:hypothetical protein
LIKKILPKWLEHKYYCAKVCLGLVNVFITLIMQFIEKDTEKIDNPYKKNEIKKE